MLSNAAKTTAVVLLLAALCGCRDEPDEAPPVGQGAAAGIGGTASATPTVDTRSAASRQADFRLAMHDARAQLLAALEACRDDACRERALRGYDAAIADASRGTGLQADEVLDLQSGPAFGAGAAPLVQVSGNRG